jgi:hypothetical protein
VPELKRIYWPSTEVARSKRIFTFHVATHCPGGGIRIHSVRFEGSVPKRLTPHPLHRAIFQLKRYAVRIDFGFERLQSTIEVHVGSPN